MSDDQAPLHLANLLGRGYTMSEARRLCGLDAAPEAPTPAADVEEAPTPAADVDDEAAPVLPFSTKPVATTKKPVAVKKPVAAKKPTGGLL